MSGHRKFRDIQHKATPEQLERAGRELDRAVTLAELRKALDMTQVQLANSLGLNQSGVSRIEHQTDVFLSTMRSYVEALGGRLELSAIFDDAVVSITTLEELAEPVPA